MFGGFLILIMSICGNTCRLRPTRKQNNTIIHPSGNIVVVFLPLFFPIPNAGHFLFQKCSATSPGKPSRKLHNIRVLVRSGENWATMSSGRLHGDELVILECNAVA